jgi:hypothetical protein
MAGTSPAMTSREDRLKASFGMPCPINRQYKKPIGRIMLLNAADQPSAIQ